VTSTGEIFFKSLLDGKEVYILSGGRVTPEAKIIMSAGGG